MLNLQLQNVLHKNCTPLYNFFSYKTESLYIQFNIKTKCREWAKLRESIEYCDHRQYIYTFLVNMYMDNCKQNKNDQACVDLDRSSPKRSSSLNIHQYAFSSRLVLPFLKSSHSSAFETINKWILTDAQVFPPKIYLCIYLLPIFNIKIGDLHITRVILNISRYCNNWTVAYQHQICYLAFGCTALEFNYVCVSEE